MNGPILESGIGLDVRLVVITLKLQQQKNSMRTRQVYSEEIYLKYLTLFEQNEDVTIMDILIMCMN
jgi:hypothetical protein